jgi:hypothetical protein
LFFEPLAVYLESLVSEDPVAVKVFVEKGKSAVEVPKNTVFMRLEPGIQGADAFFEIAAPEMGPAVGKAEIES